MRRGSTSVRLWLVAALFAFPALLLASSTRNDAVTRSTTAADQLSFHGDALATAWQHTVAPGTELFLPAHVRYGTHALPRTFASGTLLGTVFLISPAFAEEHPTRQSDIALATVPCRSGQSRAPPTA
jgi:hypothetical protein